LKSRLLLLWSIVVLFVVGTGIGLVWFDHQVRNEEFERTKREAALANDAFVEHTRQVVGQADNLLRAVRSHFLHTRSVAQTEVFIASIGLEESLYENIYLIDPDGDIVITHDAVAKVRNTADRDYFRFHRTTPDDVVVIAATEKGRISNKDYYFRITRRITLPDGSFGGVLVINVRPGALTDYFARLSPGAASSVALVGISDRRIRARYPEPDAAVFAQSLQTPLWDALAKANAGTYRSLSSVDGTLRQHIYKQVGDLPLVMVTGFADLAVEGRVAERVRLIMVAAAAAVSLIILLAFILTLLARQRQAQERYLAELKGVNDRSSALFNATQDAVILLDGDRSIECNPGALKMFGATSKEESLGFSPWSPLFTPPLQSDGTESAVHAKRSSEQALKDGTHRFEFLYKRIDTGDEFQVDIMLTAIESNGKTILQAVLRDITERVRFEQRIQAANEQLANRNEEQSRFIAMLSHELKTPISVIQILAGNQGVSPSVRDRISRSIADMNTLIERCVLSGQMEHGDVVISPSVCRIDQLIINIQSASGNPERLTIRADNVPACTTDAQLLNIILTNLVENALKYGAKEVPIAIRVSAALDSGRSGLQVEIANAPGSAGTPDPELIFSKYYRAKGAHGESGSGLGLYIASGLANKLGGALRYQLTNDQIVFTLWIPV
jgi:PAS domain S-box-containing protein